jgi:spore photoproduct lyase
MSLVNTKRKNLIIRPSGRSTDFLTPTIIMGCGFQCSYCYCKRYKTEGVDVATNINDILTEIDHHVWFADVEKPNQTHPEFVSYDLGCNSDMALHAKHYDWRKVFDFFKNHPKAMGSFATKYVNEDLLTYNPEGKIRIRFSLMPEKYANKLEPNTTSIDLRIKNIDRFIKAGYDVHINFSPVIVEKDWLIEYGELFRKVQGGVEYKDKVKAEVIFLTHNEGKHKYNLAHKLPGEHLLWVPKIQERKISQYGGENIRYEHNRKADYIKQFIELHDEIIPWNTIRYCFTFLLLLSQIV